VSNLSVAYGEFTLERTYRAPVASAFAAWADPDAKARWFAGPDATHSLDFRDGGIETVVSRLPDGREVTFESIYRDIRPNERIVYSSTLSTDGVLATVSITTVEFRSDGTGSRLVLTEQDTYLDGQELPDWREQGTGTWLDALGADLEHEAITN
jgi:uncharacterized protein YndB with AHSA1/START domain